MSIEPLISICMPVYNAAPFLAEAIQGILSQTYSNLELVITDNCSTDGSIEIAQQFASKDSRIRYYQNTWNVGYAGNAYKVTSLGRGDFILMHGADDVLMPGALQTYVNFIRESDEPQRLVLMSDFEQGEVYGQSQIRLTLDLPRFGVLIRSLDFTPAQRVIYLHGQDVLRVCLPELRSFGGVGSVLVARALYEQVEGYLSHHWYNPDKFFIYKILSLNPQIVWLCEPLYFYRWHESNQFSLERNTAVLRRLLDEYAYTFEFPNDFYTNFGFTKQEVINTFINQDCLNAGLREIAMGNRGIGSRNIFFALATYPGTSWHNVKTYFALIALALGPLGSFLTKTLYDLYKFVLSRRCRKII